jgi:hypothetical protein
MRRAHVLSVCSRFPSPSAAPTRRFSWSTRTPRSASRRLSLCARCQPTPSARRPTRAMTTLPRPSRLTPGWQVRATVPWAVGSRWFAVHAAAPHVRPLFGPILWGMPALRACGATLHIGTSAVGDAAEPYSPPAAHAHVAALSRHGRRARPRSRRGRRHRLERVPGRASAVALAPCRGGAQGVVGVQGAPVPSALARHHHDHEAVAWRSSRSSRRACTIRPVPATRQCCLPFPAC